MGCGRVVILIGIIVVVVGVSVGMGLFFWFIMWAILYFSTVPRTFDYSKYKTSTTISQHPP